MAIQNEKFFESRNRFRHLTILNFLLSFFIFFTFSILYILRHFWLKLFENEKARDKQNKNQRRKYADLRPCRIMAFRQSQLIEMDYEAYRIGKENGIFGE